MTPKNYYSQQDHNENQGGPAMRAAAKVQAKTPGGKSKHPTKLIKGLKTALRTGASFIPGVSDIMSAIDVGRSAFELGSDIYDAFRPPRHAESKTVERGSVATPSAAPAYYRGSVGNAVASRSGMGTPVAFRNWNHPSLGPSLRLRGTQVFSMVTQAPGTAASFASLSEKRLQPKAMQYIVALMADVHACYRFQSIRLRYVPGCPTTTPGQVRIAYLPDPGGSAYDTLNFLTTSLSPYQLTCAAWEPASLTISPVPCAYDKLYQHDAVGDPAALRTTVQGIVTGFWNGNCTWQAAETTVGTLEIDYELDLYSPGPSIAGLPTLLRPLTEMRQAYARGEGKVGDQLKVHVFDAVDRLARDSGPKPASFDSDAFLVESPQCDPMVAACCASVKAPTPGAISRR